MHRHAIQKDSKSLIRNRHPCIPNNMANIIRLGQGEKKNEVKKKKD